MQLHEINLKGITKICADISGGRKMSSSVELPVVTSKMMEKHTNVLYILSLQETNIRYNSKVQTMTLADMDVERRSNYISSQCIYPRYVFIARK